MNKHLMHLVSLSITIVQTFCYEIVCCMVMTSLYIMLLNKVDSILIVWVCDIYGFLWSFTCLSANEIEMVYKMKCVTFYLSVKQMVFSSAYFSLSLMTFNICLKVQLFWTFVEQRATAPPGVVRKHTHNGMKLSTIRPTKSRSVEWHSQQWQSCQVNTKSKTLLRFHVHWD